MFRMLAHCSVLTLHVRPIRASEDSTLETKRRQSSSAASLSNRSTGPRERGMSRSSRFECDVEASAVLCCGMCAMRCQEAKRSNHLDSFPVQPSYLQRLGLPPPHGVFTSPTLLTMACARTSCSDTKGTSNTRRNPFVDSLVYRCR